VRDRAANLSGKLFALVDNEHSVVGGIETEGTWRAETASRPERRAQPPTWRGLRRRDLARALYAGRVDPTPPWSAPAACAGSLLTTDDPGDGSLVRNLQRLGAIGVG
jgi:hypothetical protein